MFRKLVDVLLLLNKQTTTILPEGRTSRLACDAKPPVMGAMVSLPTTRVASVTIMTVGMRRAAIANPTTRCTTAATVTDY